MYNFKVLSVVSFGYSVDRVNFITNHITDDEDVICVELAFFENAGVTTDTVISVVKFAGNKIVVNDFIFEIESALNVTTGKYLPIVDREIEQQKVNTVVQFTLLPNRHTWYSHKYLITVCY